MGILETIMGLFPGQSPETQQMGSRIGQQYLQNPMGNAPSYDNNNIQRDLFNLYQAMQDTSGLNPTLNPGAPTDIIGALQHIFGNQINDAASAANYATGGADSMIDPNWQPGTPDVQLGPSGPVKTGGQNPYATQENSNKAKEQGKPSLQGQPTPEFAAPNQWLGSVQNPIPGQGQVTSQPQGSGAPNGPMNATGTVDPYVAQFLAETGASFAPPVQQPTSAPQTGGPKVMPSPEAQPEQPMPAPDTQTMIQLISSGGQFTDPESGQMIDFSQMDDAQKYQLLVALLGGQESPQTQGAPGAEDTGYVGP